MTFRIDDQRMKGESFAWLPTRTVTGWVWLEAVLWERIPSWGWGSGDEFIYHRYGDANEFGEWR